MSNHWEVVEFYARQPDSIIPDIATALKGKELCLMVGAGVSYGLDLPLWHELVIACCGRAPGSIGSDDINKRSTGEDLLARMSKVRRAYGSDQRAYLAAVSDALYEKWKSPSISKAPEIMRAIGALVMGSTRGRINTIINFNFDSLLEWYLRYHGYTIQVIEDAPRKLLDSDVRVFHPHGFLPLDATFGRRSGMILFDTIEHEERVVNRSDAWMDIFRFIIGTQVFIALGMSGRDPMTNLLLSAAKLQRRGKDTDPLGFWFVETGSLEEDHQENLAARGVVVVEVDSYDCIPTILFEICQAAAGAII